MRTCTRCKNTDNIKELTYVSVIEKDIFYLCDKCLGRTTTIWPVLNHLFKEEFVHPKYMNVKLLVMVDQLIQRSKDGRLIIVHRGYDPKSKPLSQHRIGNAIDFHFRGIHHKEQLCREFVLLDMYWPGGLGVYPHWNNPGFHLDLGDYRRWGRDEKGNYLKLLRQDNSLQAERELCGLPIKKVGKTIKRG
jgi:hypothetical protein